MKTKTIVSALVKVFAISAALSAPAFAAMSEADVEPYLKKQGCMKCHAMDKTKKGPSWKKLSAKFKGKANAEQEILKNLTTSPTVKLEDGTEEEHKEIETKDKEELKVITKWIMTR